MRKKLPGGIIAASLLIVSLASWNWVTIAAAVIAGLVVIVSLVVGGIELWQWRARRAVEHKANIATVKLNVSVAMERVKLLQEARRQMPKAAHVLQSISDHEIKFQNPPALAANNAAKALAIPAQVAAPMVDLLPEIQHLDNLLIVGGKGTCKTTLMQYLEAYRNQIAASVVLDTHARPGQWRGKMIGQGRDYGEIVKHLLLLIGEMNKRYNSESYLAGRPFTPVTQFIDEFTLLPKKLKDLHDFDIGQGYSSEMLTEGRKVAMNCVWGIHSDRAGPMGLEGRSDLKECFDAIIRLKKVGNERHALVDFGDGADKERRYRLPPPFVVAGQAGQTVPVFSEPSTPPLVSEEDQIRQMITDGKKNYAICQALDWKPGGSKYARIDTIRAESPGK